MALILTLIIGLITPSGPQAPAREAAAKIISARLAEGDVDGALAAYDAHLRDQKQPDEALLRDIAAAELRRLASQSSGPPRVIALEHLARGSDQNALAMLRTEATRSAEDSVPGMAPFFSLVNLGDQAAMKRLPLLLRTAPPDVKVALLEVLRDAGAKKHADLIVPLLDEADQSVRTAAVLTLGALEHTPAVEHLRALAEGDHPVDRLTAAIALRRMGDRGMEARVRPLLGGILPELRLMAAEAYSPAESSVWLGKVKELGNDRNELNRVRAAEVMACCDPAGARSILLAALDSRLPSIQAAAAHALADPRLADPRVARRLLGSSDAEVRAHGAVAAMTAAER